YRPRSRNCQTLFWKKLHEKCKKFKSPEFARNWRKRATPALVDQLTLLLNPSCTEPSELKAPAPFLTQQNGSLHQSHIYVYAYTEPMRATALPDKQTLPVSLQSRKQANSLP
ncbi:hypothetical protein, partial [Thalassospira profundimaris]|uniref:hypothetical protein n=1 Tax=Thalassospira profundimaris TaxID=502049 RepID=UPI001C68B2F9